MLAAKKPGGVGEVEKMSGLSTLEESVTEQTATEAILWHFNVTHLAFLTSPFPASGASWPGANNAMAIPRRLRVTHRLREWDNSR